jgi:DNA repair protein RecO (recombination protein O)
LRIKSWLRVRFARNLQAMDWIDSAIVLHVRPHGETSAILDAFTREHGRHAGLVRGGRSRKIRPALQTGNLLKVEWRARLSEHLGFFTLELAQPYAARALDDRLALSGIGSMATLAGLLAERDPHPALFDMAILVLDHLDDATLWLELMVRWELLLLTEFGFGLDLERCAATGTGEDLIYVSPKSGCAVSRLAGEPYKDKLLKLPAFLLVSNGPRASRQDIADGFALTGFFLERCLAEQRNAPLPPVRREFLRVLARTPG